MGSVSGSHFEGMVDSSWQIDQQDSVILLRLKGTNVEKSIFVVCQNEIAKPAR